MPDPDAPPGAPATWLPDEPWVQERWLPYSEVLLHRVLKTNQRQLSAWFAIPGRNLWQFARSKRVNPNIAIRALVRPWRGHVSAARYRELRRRTRRTFTQAHLTDHMLFHTFHVQSLSRVIPEMTGVDFRELGRLRAEGLSQLDIGERNGKSPEFMMQVATQALRDVARRGVRRHEVPRAQARRQLRVQLANLDAWLSWKSSSPSPMPM